MSAKKPRAYHRMGNHKSCERSVDVDLRSTTDSRRGDRRRNHFKAFFVQFRTPRRRRAGRRKTDTQGFHTDFHEPTLLLLVLVTMSLCVVDVYATLTLLQHGGRELNPLMRGLIETDVWLFYMLKYGVTAAGLFVLVSYKRFVLYKGFSGLHTLYGVMGIYVLLVIYQIRLLAAAAG